MNLAQLLTSRELWRGREIKAYREWRRLVKKRASTMTGSKRVVAHATWEKAHDERVARDRQIAKRRSEEVVTHVDDEGVKFIIQEEGERNVPYPDSNGDATTGVGHWIHKGPVTAADRRKWTLTDAEVATLLKKDLARFDAVVRKVLKGTPFEKNHHVFNACVSLAFNIGVGGFLTSTVARMLRKGKKSAAAAAFRMWGKPPELLPRRNREIALFNK